MTNSVLKQHILERLRSMKPQIVDIENCFDSLSQLDVDAGVINVDAGIDKICLALNFAATQTWQHAVWLHEADACLRQTNTVAVPIRKLAANKIRIIKNGVKSRCLLSVGLLSPWAQKTDPLKRR